MKESKHISLYEITIQKNHSNSYLFDTKVDLKTSPIIEDVTDKKLSRSLLTINQSNDDTKEDK